MKRTVSILTIIFLILSCISFTTANNEESNNRTIFVDDDNTTGPWDGSIEHPYKHVQQAIDNASSFDTIFIFNGMYDHITNYGYLNSNLACVDKPLTIIGEDKNNTILDGKGHDIIDLHTTPVSVRNLMLYNGTSDNIFIGSGINKIDRSYFSDFDQITIDNCIFKNNNEGIHIQHEWCNVSNVSITNCQFIENKEGIYFTGDNESYNLENVLISNCLFDKCYSDPAIDIIRYIHNPSDNKNILNRNITISNCVLKENKYGIIIWSFNNVIDNPPICPEIPLKTSIIYPTINTSIIESQHISESSLSNLIPSYYDYSYFTPAMENVIIENNILDDNYIVGIGFVGSFLETNLRNNIISNKFDDEYKFGVNVDLSSNGVIVSNNQITNSYYGLRNSYCEPNKILNNNFINNTHNAFIFSEIPGLQFNNWKGNYFDDYQGFGPKFIRGLIDEIGQWRINFKIPWYNIDWQPAKEPYDLI